MARHDKCSDLWIAVCATLGLTTLPASAGDWTVTASLTETILATDNVDFDIDDRAPALGSNTSIGLGIAARSYLYDFNLLGSWGYQVYFGGNQDIPDPQFIPALSASYERRAKDLTFEVDAAYVYTPGEAQRGITIVPGEQGGEGEEPTDDTVAINTTDNNADRQVVSANTTVAYKINDTNDLNWATRAARIDFFGDNADDATPSTNAGTSLSWSHLRTRRVDLNLSAGVDWYSYENDENQVDYVYYLTGGFTNRVTRNLTINGSLGVRLLDSYQDVATGVPPNVDWKSDHSTDLGGSGSFGARYRLKTGSISGSVSYGLTPDDDGELANSLTATLGYFYTINDRSTFSLGAGYRLSDSDVDGVLSNTSISISPRYGYALTQDWDLGLGYTFSLQNDEEGSAIENSVSLTVSRAYTILP